MVKLVNISKNNSKVPKVGITKVKKEKPKKKFIETKKVSPTIEKEKKKKKRSIGKIILIAILSLGIAVLGLGILFTIYIIINAPEFNTDLLYNKEATVIYDKSGNEIAKIGSEKRVLVTYDELPQVLVDAILATEDSRFYQHNGFDIARFGKATIGQLLGNSNAGGASTLTMQVIKNTYTSTNASGIKGIIRKFTDIYMAIFKVEKSYTKEEIIEFYVNAPWLGNGVYGIEQASLTYFGKSVKDISLEEAAILAGMFNAPASYNPFNSIEKTTKRRNIVLDLMVRHGYITEEQANDAKEVSVESLITKKTSMANPYQGFIDTVVEDVLAKTGNDPYIVPMKIYSTMDAGVQDVLNDFKDGNLYKFYNDVVQVGVAVTSLDDGSIVGVINGRNVKGERQYNRATQMTRQPGSTAKPVFDYGPYLEFNNGSTYSPFFDEAMTYSNGTSLKNADGSYLGMLTMRQALSKSRNIPAVQAFQQTEKDKIGDFAHALGIDYGDELHESTAIGGFDPGFSPLQASAAYASFGRGGYYIEPYSYTKIEYLNTGKTEDYNYEKEKVMSDSTAYMITSILETAKASGIAGNTKGSAVACKSGTTTIDGSARKELGLPANAAMDSWLNCYNPEYSISLWYGYDKLSSSNYLTSSSGASSTYISRQKMMPAMANKIFDSSKSFSKPGSVTSATVEKETIPAMLPSEFTPEDFKVTELFKVGTEPSEVSSRFSKLTAPSNVTANASGSTINISWDAVAIPDFADTTYLTNYFNENYGQFASKYYQKRLTYNASYIGEFGYEVYLQNNDGSLTYLGFTQNNSYSYTASTSATTFVVKSAYSIFKNNKSDGTTVTASGTVSPVTPSLTISLNAGDNLCIVQGSTFTDPGITVTDSSGTTITPTVTETWKDSTNTAIGKTTAISTLGNYKITYAFTNDGYSYAKIRNVVVQTTCP